MNKKLLLGALIGAGMSMLNKKMRQSSAPGAAAGHPDLGQSQPGRPDFSKVPPPTQSGDADAPSLDDILARAGRPGGLNPSSPSQGGDIFGGAIPAGAGAGGAAVLMEMARRIFAQMQQSGGGMPGQMPGGGVPGGNMGGGLGDILGQIFGSAAGKFGQQGPQGPQENPGNWQKLSPRGKGGLFGFVNSADDSGGAGGEDQADAMLKAMVAAAQADGQIDEAEQHTILQAMNGQLDASDLDEFRGFLTTPIGVDEVVAAADNPATAFNLYLVSAMTANVDNAQERQYLDTLAEKLGISKQAAQVIEQQLPH